MSEWGIRTKHSGPPPGAPSGRRVDLTGYGSKLLGRVSRVAPRCEEITGTGLRALCERVRRGLPWLLLYRLLLPSVEVQISSQPSGVVLRQQLTYRRGGRLAFRHAQGVLFLPTRYSDYLRGRGRQAVRTNIRRARERGYVLEDGRYDQWTLDPRDPRSGHITATAPLEYFHINDPGGTRVAEAFITVDNRVALLHMATATVSYARWLLHAAIVERLCGECDLLITNTEDVPLMASGSQHYQRLLGYSIVRLRLGSIGSEMRAHPGTRALGLCLLGTCVIVCSDSVFGLATPFGLTTLTWVTTLVAIRRASYRAGPAAGTAAVAAITVLLLRDLSDPMTVLGFALAGVVLDVLLACIPRLTWSSLSVTPAGVTITLLALLMSEVDRLGLHDAPAWGGVSFCVPAALCGAVAAGGGWWLGGQLVRLIRVPAAGATV